MKELEKCRYVDIIVDMPILWTILMNQHFVIFAQFLANVNSSCLSSVTLVRPTQAVQIFGNISTALAILAIH